MPDATPTQEPARYSVVRHRTRLARGSAAMHAAVEEALAGEQANAMGRAGRRLEDAIEDHRLLVAVGHATTEQLDAALADVADAAWSLMVQRECAGIRTDNLAQIRRHYAIPAAALKRL